MSRGPLAFKQRDMTRALRAAQAAGLKAYRVELDDAGKPVIVVGAEVDKQKVQDLGSWDSVIAELESR